MLFSRAVRDKHTKIFHNTGRFNKFDIILQYNNFASSRLNDFEFCTTQVDTNKFF